MKSKFIVFVDYKFCNEIGGSERIIIITEWKMIWYGYDTIRILVGMHSINPVIG